MIKKCSICGKDMDNPFGQLFFCKNECDLKAKKIPELISKMTAPLRSLGDNAEKCTETIRQMGKVLEKQYLFRQDENVRLTQEGNRIWASSWGSDGQVTPKSYPFKEGDRGYVLEIQNGMTVFAMYGYQKWWIKLRADQVHVWFEKE